MHAHLHLTEPAGRFEVKHDRYPACRRTGGDAFETVTVRQGQSELVVYVSAGKGEALAASFRGAMPPKEAH